MRSRKLKQLKTTMIFLTSRRFQVVLEAKNGNAFSVEKFPWRKCILISYTKS